MKHRSILDLFNHNVDNYPGDTAAMVKRGGAYQDVSWGEIGTDARAISAGLIGLGVQPGDRVCIIANTRLEWVAADMGILGAGAVTVPIYPSNLPDECHYIIDNSDGVVVITEDDSQTEKLRSERARLRGVKKIVQLTGDVAGDDWVITLEQLIALGDGHGDTLTQRAKSLSPESILTIIYTSGTTGRPKGVVTTHDGMLYEAECITELDLVVPEDLQLLFLPLAHSFAKLLVITWLATRHIMAFAEKLETLKDNLREVQPTLMGGVPRIFEKFHAATVQKGTSAGGLKSKLFEAACRLSERNGRAEQKGRGLAIGDAVKFKLLKKLVFKKVGVGLKAALGGRIRLMISGGAPLSPKIHWFFRDAGLTILEGYGLTETSAGTFLSRPDHYKIGKVGQVVRGTEVKIADDGEILVKGRGIMREYWKRPEATAEVIKDGWFYTGDVGELDAEGFLTITDRKKDIIVTAGGKNIAPQNIENLLKTHKLVSQVVVHGDKRKFLSALITVDPDAIKEFAAANNLGTDTYAVLSQRPELYEAVKDAVGQVNSQLPQYETIKKFKILEHDFSQQSGELTPTLKIKRKVITERYSDIFDNFYNESYS